MKFSGLTNMTMYESIYLQDHTNFEIDCIKKCYHKVFKSAIKVDNIKIVPTQDKLLQDKSIYMLKFTDYTQDK